MLGNPKKKDSPMPAPSFLAVTDTVPECDGRFLVCLGRPDVPPEALRGRALLCDQVDDTVLSHLAELNPKLMAQGLVIVTATREYKARPRAVLTAQKLLAYRFMKYAAMPLRCTRVPDPVGLRPAETPPEYLHQLNLYRNTPLHLRHCLVDKLEQQHVGLPCLLLLPGPSLAPLAPHLPELGRRFLLVAISRTLPFLRRHGITPDVLLQLDTVPMQRHFHQASDRFPRSVLLALSMAPIRTFAPRFRRVFFIDSFNLSVLPNTSRIRESWLSSLLALLGCAETLHAPRVLLAGADLRLVGKDVYCNERTGDPEAGLPAYDAPMTCLDGENVVFADAKGRQARSSLQYFATAGETELFARDIQAAQATTFGNLSPLSILDETVFPYLPVREALDAPLLDKTVFLDKADAADTAKEAVSLRSMRALYTRCLEEAHLGSDLMACLRLGDPDKLGQQPSVRYVAANLPWFRPADPKRQRDMAANLARELHLAVRFARNVTTLHLLAAKGKAIPVLATADEEEHVRKGLSQWRPDWTWQVYGVEALGYEAPMPSGGGIRLVQLHNWMADQEAVIVAPGLADEFHYVLPLAMGENVLALDDLLAYRPVAME